MRITDHVYMLSGAPYGHIGNVYAVLSEEKVILIDTGRTEEARQLIVENLRYHGLDKYPLTHVLLTHMHDDHAGNAYYFREQGAAVWCSEPDASGVENGGVRANDLGIFPFQTCKIDRKLTDGETIQINGIEIRVLYMPGHTNGSVFYQFEIDGKKMVASGDVTFPKRALFDNGLEADIGWGGSYEYSKSKLLESLEKAISVECDALLGGHGVPIMKDGHLILKLAFKKALVELR